MRTVGKRLLLPACFCLLAVIVFATQFSYAGFYDKHHGWITAHALALADHATPANAFVGHALTFVEKDGELDHFYFDRYPVFFTVFSGRTHPSDGGPGDAGVHRAAADARHLYADDPGSMAVSAASGPVAAGGAGWRDAGFLRLRAALLPRRGALRSSCAAGHADPALRHRAGKAGATGTLALAHHCDAGGGQHGRRVRFIECAGAVARAGGGGHPGATRSDAGATSARHPRA